MKTNLNRGWHVLYVKPRHEKKVYQQLLERKIEAYLPLAQTERKWSDRTKRVVLPLFKSYVFVNIKTAMDFHTAPSVNGVYTYISFGKDYAIVRDEEIEKIKFLVSTEGIEDVKIEEGFLNIGELKVIANGPLSGLECEVLQIKNKNLVNVRLGSLKQNITATVPSEFLSELSEVALN